MAYTLQSGTGFFEIVDYLVVHPFAFTAPLGDLQIQPQFAFAVFNLATSGVPAGHDWLSETENLDPSSRFEVVSDTGQKILVLSHFDLVMASTPASLDMNRATWVLQGAGDPRVKMEFTPPSCTYPFFGTNVGKKAYWGARVGDDLSASLSVPVYSLGSPRYVVNYFALGPANANGSSRSLFEWVVNQGAAPTHSGATVASTSSGPLSTMDVEDLRTGLTNKFFGADPGGRSQASGANGAVFVMNGEILKAPWRSVALLIRQLAELQGIATVDDIAKLIEGFASPLDQTVIATSEPEKRHFSISNTPDFEGIALWDLKMRNINQDSATMHR